MLVNADGQAFGVLSGGCLEEEIAHRAVEVLQTGTAQLLQFDTRRLFGCAGFLEILVERIPVDGEGGSLLATMYAQLQQRRPCRVLTRYKGPDCGSRVLGATELVAEEGGVLIHNILPPPRLVVFGSGPEIPALCRMGETLGWELAVLPGVAELPENFAADDQTAVLVMTHNFGRDLAALHKVLPMGLRYVGLLGPRRRQAELLTQLQEFAPLPSSALESLYSPAGLDIGSESPEEIALSIISEITAVLAGRRGGFLRERARAIHAPAEKMVAVA
jgi:xanthine dehydrogenase accessory factor